MEDAVIPDLIRDPGVYWGRLFPIEINLQSFLTAAMNFEPFIDCLDIEKAGIKIITAKPFNHLIMLRVAGITDDLQQILIAERTPAILRRAGPDSFKADAKFKINGIG